MFEAFIDSQPGSIALGIIWGIMAIGVYVTYKVLDIADLTVDGSFSTGGAVLVVCVTSGMNIWLAMLLAFISGCIAGLVTAIFHTKFGIPAILAGILTQLALYSINLRILGGMANLPVSFRKYNLLITLSDIPKSLIMGGLFTVALIAVLYWFFGTEIGHSLRATGCNQTMSRANGVNTNVAKTIGIVLSNGIVAFSGALLAQYNGYADINMGKGAIVIGLAAVIIGEVVFGKIFRNFALKLLSVVIGGVAYYFFINLVLTLGLPANDLKLLQAVIVAVFLGIPYWKNSITKGKHKIKKENKGGVINA